MIGEPPSRELRQRNVRNNEAAAVHNQAIQGYSEPKALVGVATLTKTYLSRSEAIQARCAYKLDNAIGDEYADTRVSIECPPKGIAQQAFRL